eukprot:9592185-Alexandrium_andersonii.AAC.1
MRSDSGGSAAERPESGTGERTSDGRRLRPCLAGPVRPRGDEGPGLDRAVRDGRAGRAGARRRRRTRDVLAGGDGDALATEERDGGG